MMRKSLWACIAGFVALSIWACGDDKGNGTPTTDTYNKLTLDFFSAAPLPSSMIYQLWAAPPSGSLASQTTGWVSLARFNLSSADTSMIDANGDPITGNVLSNLTIDLADYDSLFVTVERSTGDDAAPSSVVYLRGGMPDLAGGHRLMPFYFPLPELVTALDTISQYTFVTPTDNITDNSLSGVWFMTPNFTQGLLTLRTLPSGWDYEGWIKVERGGHSYAISVGRFDAASGNDESRTHCGPLALPGFPGEDLLNPQGTEPFPLVLATGDEIDITVEPDQDPDSLTPFPFLVYSNYVPLVPDTLQPFRFRPHPEGIPAVQAVVAKSE